jgi:hypothetical protein
MQRDILAALWLLFDEFEIGGADPPTSSKDRVTRQESDGGEHAASASARGNGRKSRRRS